MSPQDAERWRAARTLADLGELTAQWLEGTIASIPTVWPGCGPDDETVELIPVLAACNRAGYVTTVSQPGEEPGPGYDGRLWTQRAAVQGFASADAIAALRACTVGTLLIVLVTGPADNMERDQETRIPVTLAGDQENTWFGSHLDRGDIEDDQAGYGICHPDALDALRAAWQVTIIDPQWGPQRRALDGPCVLRGAPSGMTPRPLGPWDGRALP
jgi:Domain of unknown function (DUF6919)